MSRVVTYLTDRAHDVSRHFYTSVSLWLSFQRGTITLDDARVQSNYALESPDELPCGACEYDEIFTGEEEDNGLPGYTVMAQQISVRRE